ncbi:MAG: DUF6279 family lipoprotein, partial [Pseudomonadota bacterium]
MKPTSSISRALKASLVTASILFLVACSGTTFLYNRLGTIIPWYVDRYVDLTRDQKSFLKEELKPFLAWHRQEELPFYLELLQFIEMKVQQPLTQADVREIYDRSSLIFDHLNVESTKWSIALGEKLSDEQIEEFLEKLQEDQAEYEEKYLPRTDEEYREENVEEIVDSFENFLGRLTEEQRVLVAMGAAQLQRWDSLWLSNRQQWLDDLTELLEREPGWQQRAMAMVDRQDENFSEEYNTVYEHNIDVMCGLIAEVNNVRTPKQERKALRKLAGYKEDLET